LKELQANMSRLTIPPELVKQIFEASTRLQQALAPIGQQLIAFAKDWPTLEELNERGRRDIVLLAQHGWFISLSQTPLAVLHRAAAQLHVGNIKSADGIMCEHFRQILSVVEKEAIEASPPRETIIRKAFAAYKSGEYELSIPAMLCQTEGIGHEIFGASVHSKKIHELEQIRLQFDTDESDVVLIAYYGLLTATLAIKDNIQTAEIERSRLNRHAILHGHNWQYASELNALKAISWLGFVVHFKTAGFFFFSAERDRLDQEILAEGEPCDGSAPN
jgi:hypothetical protein